MARRPPLRNSGDRCKAVCEPGSRSPTRRPRGVAGGELVSHVIDRRAHESGHLRRRSQKTQDASVKMQIEEAVLREARVRLTERMKAAETDEAPQFRAEASKVKGELANLAEAVASGGAGIPALVAKMTDRQARLTAIEGRLSALRAPPKPLQLETKP